MAGPQETLKILLDGVPPTKEGVEAALRVMTDHLDHLADRDRILEDKGSEDENEDDDD